MAKKGQGTGGRQRCTLLTALCPFPFVSSQVALKALREEHERAQSALFEALAGREDEASRGGVRARRAGCRVHTVCDGSSLRGAGGVAGREDGEVGRGEGSGRGGQGAKGVFPSPPYLFLIPSGPGLDPSPPCRRAGGSVRLTWW